MARPTQLPELATAGIRIDPGPGKRVDGYFEGDVLAAQELNYLAGYLADWVKHFATPADFVIPLEDEIIARWQVVDVIAAPFTGPPAVLGFGANAASASARRQLPIALPLNDADFAPVTLKRIELLYQNSVSSGGGNDVEVVVTRHKLDGSATPTIVANASVNLQALTPTPFTLTVNEVLDSDSAYYVSIGYTRASGTLRTFRARAVVSRAPGEAA
jgi:hypothetical protein